MVSNKSSSDYTTSNSVSDHRRRGTEMLSETVTDIQAISTFLSNISKLKSRSVVQSPVKGTQRTWRPRAQRDRLFSSLACRST